jgi:phosphatidylglycerol:prolipoprotein diacylglycerol transferase
MMNCRNGGLVWYGGVIGCVIYVVWLLRSSREPAVALKNSFPYLVLFPRSRREERIPLLQVTDTLVAPLALGLAIGRWGCLMGGCCYGKPCSLSWAVVYPPEVNPMSGIPVHPSPVYESLASLLICAVIYAAIRREARMGIPTMIWFTLYPIARFFLEFLRGDEIRGFVYQGQSFSISTSQFIGLLIIAAAIVVTITIMRRPPVPLVKAKAAEPEAPPARPAPKKNQDAAAKTKAAKAGNKK